MRDCFRTCAFVMAATLLSPFSVAAQQQHVKRSLITVYDLKSQSTKVIFTADRLIEAPNWSPDGNYLLVNTGGDLYKLHVAGGNMQLNKIDLGNISKCNNDKTLSPDGKQIAFSSSAEAKGSQVYIVSSEGGVAKKLVPETPSYFHGFSPDGKWLAFVAQRNGHFNLWRIPSEGGQQQQLTVKPAYDDGPDYSPDGKWIYFNSNRSGGWDIWRMPSIGAGSDDAKAERVTTDEGEDWFPHPSPDGKWLVFLTFPKGTAGHNDRLLVSLRMLPLPHAKLKAASPQTLVRFFGGQGTINVNSWSPDSSKIAYVVYEQ
jgi:TolB protein